MNNERSKDALPEIPFSEGLVVVDGGKNLSEKPCCDRCRDGKECDGDAKVLNG